MKWKTMKTYYEQYPVLTLGSILVGSVHRSLVDRTAYVVKCHLPGSKDREYRCSYEGAEAACKAALEEVTRSWLDAAGLVERADLDTKKEGA